MKKQVVLFWIALVTTGSLCLGQGSPSKPVKSAGKDGAIIDLEKAVTDAYKNKQTDAFKKYLASDYVGVNADGTTSLDTEVAGMEKTDLRDYSFADTKVVFPGANVAIVTYKNHGAEHVRWKGHFRDIQRRECLDEARRGLASYLSRFHEEPVVQVRLLSCYTPGKSWQV